MKIVSGRRRHSVSDTSNGINDLSIIGKGMVFYVGHVFASIIL